ncbi:MAG: universal stress protein [Pseudomonadota bacterium]
MTFQKIMVPYLSADAGAAAFGAARHLAGRFKAHMDVVNMRQHITPALPGNVYYPIAVLSVQDNYDALKQAADENAEKLRATYENLCEKHSIAFCHETEHTPDKGATAAWDDVDGAMPYELSARARVADLTVVAKAPDMSLAMHSDLTEELIFQSGRPVMMVDAEAPMTAFPETIAIAWNGGREAARAVVAAMPVLVAATAVIVVTVGDTPAGVEPPEHLVSFLRLHGVHASHLSAHAEKGEDQEEAFMRCAASRSTDMIVMGAYSHNRWRQIVLGGFSRHMLRNSKIPLFMAH